MSTRPGPYDRSSGGFGGGRGRFGGGGGNERRYEHTTLQARKADGFNLVSRAISAFKMADGREEDPGEQQIT